MPEINYTEFVKSIKEELETKRVPIDGALEVTHRCNLKCFHCYCNLPANDKIARKEELTCKDICRIIDEIVEEGCLWLLVTGGEPLAREDFLDIYIYAKRKGLLITLFTNGTLITPELARYLREWPPYKVEITLNGITKEVYERVSGVPGSFERCMEGVELLMEHKVPLWLKTTVTTLNYQQLWLIKDYAEKLGVNFRFNATVQPRLDGTKNPNRFRISPSQIVELDLRDKKHLDEWQRFCEKFWGPPRSGNLFFCGGGTNSFHIDPYGRLSICEMTRFDYCDLKKDSFKEGWVNFIPGFRSQKTKKAYKCQNCDLISLCGQCPSWAYLENKDLESPVEYLCEIAHRRAEAFGLLDKEEVRNNGWKGEKGLPKAAVT